ncbi:hypothetical protein FGW20_08740 [Methanoculleus sp. FWC-SCC3]|uniref:DUF4064 domain-containing protein n=1 Tax=Methanoculleus methanifontis TaxID=2584086 RepID=A0ABT8M3G8_9EURY|nr:hypothetical protein [Methanoculleus sp. FWC-SCC3]MDN7013126.1 hypothetical protein [Methanoculleus sp. FWC-SCC3]
MTGDATGAFIISLIGGILMLVSGVMSAFLGSICGATFAACGASGAGTTVMLVSSLGLISSIPVLIGSFFISRSDMDSVRKGSMLALIFGIIGLIFGVWGMMFLMIIGSILALVGGYMGYTLQPTS